MRAKEPPVRIGSVEFEKRGRVGWVTLDEPGKLNALSEGICEGIAGSLARIDEDDEIRVGILTGGGEKAFCAGGDISGFPTRPAEARAFIARILPLLQAPERCRKPIIAAVNGIAYGGGFELAIACDFVIASERARFAVPEIHLGLLPGFALVRLHDIVGRPKAKELSMMGEPIDAAEACRLGIALRVVPHDTLLGEANAFAEKLASRPRVAIEVAKSFYNRGLGGDEMRYAIDAFPFMLLTDDVEEGFEAFRQKRKPDFK